LSWPEGNCRFLTALRASRFCFRSYLSGASASRTTTFGSLGFAAFATLRFVLESFIGEKHLLAGCKYKLGTAFRTLQNPIVEFHERSP
jgi:hypothetical protein